MKIILLTFMIGFSSTIWARPLGTCITSRNRVRIDEMKRALSNGLLSSSETSELYTAETCGDYNKKLTELLDLYRQRQKQTVSYQ